jgi:hypothetical protein
MKKTTSNSYRKPILTGGALVLAATASVFAQQKPFMQGGTAQPPAPLAAKPAAATPEAAKDITTSTNVVDELFNGKIPDALANGKVNVNVRARYEQANEEGVPAVTKNSYAPTVRTRVGFTTAPLYGFQAMVEGVNVSAIGPEHNYNAAGSNGQGARPAVADPTLTRLDQAWAGFTYTNWVSAKVGLQQINLDNQRFIGDSGWRQNMQTFEAAGIGSEPLPDLKLYYAYVWDVHRVYGNVDDLPAANRDFDSDSHLINVSYSGWKYGRFVGYAYLLDLSNAAGDANSSATYGGYFAGAAPLNDKISVDYRAEYAFQTDYGKSPLNYSANYYNAEAGLSVKPVAFGAGYEDLGSGVNTGAAGGRTAFRAPLATLHAFNGWDDMFVNTPNDGLQDFYGYLQVTLPAQIPVRFVFHKFNAEHGGGDYGEEYDVVVSKKFGKYWTALVKYAYYNGNDPAAPALTASHVDVQRFWAQVEFNF